MNSFDSKCLKVLTRIPRGMVSTYGDVARALGTKAYRAVGNAMARNSNPVSLPCHRVIKSDGTIGGYALGSQKKIDLLISEGLTIKDGKVVNFKKFVFKF